jgi:hypothetical protein
VCESVQCCGIVKLHDKHSKCVLVVLWGFDVDFQDKLRQLSFAMDRRASLKVNLCALLSG